MGPQQGRKVFTLQTLPACDEPFDDGVGKAAGFSLAQATLSPRPGSHLVHAGVAAMTWVQRLKRVFNIDIEICRECGGAVRIMPKALATLAGQALACIEDPVVIDKILTHLQEKLTPVPAGLQPESRAPPADLFG